MPESIILGLKIKNYFSKKFLANQNSDDADQQIKTLNKLIKTREKIFVSNLILYF